MAKKVKKQKPDKIDGFGSYEKQKVSNAIRQVWLRTSHARRLCVKRCTDQEGFAFCELCKVRTPKLKVDHIVAIGSVDKAGFLNKLFCPSNWLQGLCSPCHKIKTREDLKK